MYLNEEVKGSCCKGESQCGCNSDETEVKVLKEEGCGCRSNEDKQHSCGCSH